MANLVESGSWQLYYRSMLTVTMHNVVFSLLRPIGVDGWNAIAVSSSLAGAIALQTLFAMKRHPLFLALNVCSGSFLVFVGHVENYAWINAFLLLCFWQARRCLERNKALWPAITYFLLACLSHMAAIFYIPALLYFIWKKKNYHPYEALIPILAFAALVVTLSLLFPMLGTDIGMERLVPLFHVHAPNQFFTFFSWDHLEILSYFHRHAAFLGIPIELPLLFLFRKRIQTDFLRFLLISVFCGLLWTTIWHPDWGRHDWDLFSQFAIPLHVLLGYLVCDTIRFQSNSFPAKVG